MLYIQTLSLPINILVNHCEPHFAYYLCSHFFHLINYIDVNECAIENGGCEHTCVNRAGSYRCECDQGFTLQEDGTSCGECIMQRHNYIVMLKFHILILQDVVEG